MAKFVKSGDNGGEEVNEGRGVKVTVVKGE